MLNVIYKLSVRPPPSNQLLGPQALGLTDPAGLSVVLNALHKTLGLQASASLQVSWQAPPASLLDMLAPQLVSSRKASCYHLPSLNSF